MSGEDAAIVAEWRRRPHVARWWGDPESADEIRATYLRPDRDAVRAYLAFDGDEPVGFCQVYRAVEAGDGWWPDETDPGVVGIDVFLADPMRLGRGLGTRMVRALIDLLFSDQSVTRVQTDPSPGNARAIRCFERAGFTPRGIVSTPDGDALLMTIDRPMQGGTSE